jgi:hypothetical protein
MVARFVTPDRDLRLRPFVSFEVRSGVRGRRLEWPPVRRVPTCSEPYVPPCVGEMGGWSRKREGRRSVARTQQTTDLGTGASRHHAERPATCAQGHHQALQLSMISGLAPHGDRALGVETQWSRSWRSGMAARGRPSVARGGGGLLPTRSGASSGSGFGDLAGRRPDDDRAELLEPPHHVVIDFDQVR